MIKLMFGIIILSLLIQAIAVMIVFHSSLSMLTMMYIFMLSSFVEPIRSEGIRSPSAANYF